MKVKVLGNIGKCIYCLGAGGRLNREHIVPYGLDGEWMLREASCDACATVTSAFEREVLRHALLPLRAALGLPTRNPQERPSTFPLLVQAKGEIREVQVLLCEHGQIVLLPTFLPPACRDGRPYDGGLQLAGFWVAPTGNAPGEDFLHRRSADRCGIRVMYQPMAFARLLAKIAHGFAVSAVGLDNIESAYLTPLILGRSNDAGYRIGCAEKESELSGSLHEIRADIHKGEFIARIRLFAPLRPPEYLVVAARVRDNLESSASLE